MRFWLIIFVGGDKNNPYIAHVKSPDDVNKLVAMTWNIEHDVKNDKQAKENEPDAYTQLEKQN